MSDPEKKPETKTWRDTYITSIKTYKSPTPTQALIIELNELTTRTPRQNRDLDTLLRAEEAREKLAAISQRATQIARTAAAEKEKTARQIRNKRLIDHGLLVELAKLHERTDAELLGVLLSVAGVEDPERWAGWSKFGAQRLAERDAADAARRAKQAEKQAEKKAKAAKGKEQ